VLSEWLSIGIYPVFLLVFALLMAAMSERMNRIASETE